MSMYPVIIGRFENIDLVGKIKAVPSKIDSGAYGSSIHATSIKEQKAKQMLEFTLLGHPSFTTSYTMKTTKYSVVEVRSSNGHLSVRYEVNLKIKIGHKIFVTPFTLTDRSKNVFPVLIGRKALAKRFIVDVSKSGVSRAKLVEARNVIFIDDTSKEIE